MCKILKKRYSDLTVGEILGWSLGVGVFTLAIEVISLKGLDTIKDEINDTAEKAKVHGQETMEQIDETFKVLKAKLHK